MWVIKPVDPVVCLEGQENGICQVCWAPTAIWIRYFSRTTQIQGRLLLVLSALSHMLGLNEDRKMWIVSRLAIWGTLAFRSLVHYTNIMLGLCLSSGVYVICTRCFGSWPCFRLQVVCSFGGIPYTSLGCGAWTQEYEMPLLWWHLCHSATFVVWNFSGYFRLEYFSSR
jgi:hypothetical protein